MNDRSGIFGFIDKLNFKPTDKGWVYKEPALWRRKTYLLSDAEKMRLVRPVRLMSIVMAIIVMVAIGIQDFVSDRFSVSPTLTLAVVTIVAMVISWTYVAIFMRPHLSGLTATDERITFFDQIRMQAAALPRPLVIVWLVACLAFVAVGLGMTILDGWDWKDAAGVALFAVFAAYPAALLVVRGRQAKVLRQ